MYIKLVLCRECCSENFIAEAPAFHYMNSGDEVMIDFSYAGYKNPPKRVEVIDSIDVDNNSTTYNFISKALNLPKKLPRVSKVVKYEEIVYDDFSERGHTDEN